MTRWRALRFSQSECASTYFNKVKTIHDKVVKTEPGEESIGLRLDKVVAEWLTDYSRARLQSWISEGAITVNGETVAPRYRIRGGELIEAVIPEPASQNQEVGPENIPLQVHYSDDQLHVINKPAGLVMHTAPGNLNGTLQNALLYLDPDLANLPRAGIVHRLDKDTSGLVMIARTLESHFSLVQQLQERRVHRVYDAIVHGEMVAGGTVDEPIGRHPVDRKRMAVNEKGKRAVTHYRVIEKFKRHCHIEAKLETGRTHQIRVHMSHIQHPLVGDAVYGRRNLPGGVSEELKKMIVGFPRQALHARELGIEHPASGEEVQWQEDMPQDMQQLLSSLRNG